MRPAPATLYDNVLAFSRGAGGDSRTANVGGVWRTPNYALSYLFAARLTLEQAGGVNRVDEVALPIAYLQRHALELGIKSLIDLAYGLADDEERIRLARTTGATESGTPRRADRTHDLNRLVRDLADALAKVGSFDAPEELEHLAQLLATVEVDVPDRLRYREIGKRNRRPTDSMPEAKSFRLADVQERLENAFLHHLVYRPEAIGDIDADDWNILEALSAESEALFQQLLQLGVEP